MTGFLSSPKPVGLFALALMFAASLVNAGEKASTSNHADFGPHPDEFTATTLEPTPAGPITLREKLMREGVLDEATFAASTRSPLKLRSRPAQDEELP